MRNARNIHHNESHPGFNYPTHLSHRIYTLIALPLALVVVTYLILRGVHQPSWESVSLLTLISALVASVGRLLVAYLLAIALAIPLALIINRSRVTERVLLPAFDVLQSIPVLAFFPVVIIFFVQYHFLNAAAVFLIFINMLWNLVFSVIGGLRQTPGDVKAAAQVFHIRGWHYFRQILAPAIFPYLVTGSLLAWAEGWNMLIVAEVLHTYLPGAGPSTDLFGIGSVLVHASAAGQQGLFVAAILTMVVAIALMNFFIWQKLLHYAERYRFD